MNNMNQEATLPKMWDDFSLRPYLGEISRRHGIIESIALPSMRDLPPLRIESLFVSPLLAENLVSADSEPTSWPEGKSLLVTLQEHPQLVVLGDPGGGKTTLSNWLAWRLSVGLTAPLPPVLEGRIPLPCVLREMSSAVFTPELTLPELAVKIAERLLGNKADDALKASLRVRVMEGSYVLILDGVDEIPVPHRKIVAEWVRNAAEQGVPVLATSRIVGYEDGPVDHFDVRVDLSKTPENRNERFSKYIIDSSQLKKLQGSVLHPIDINDEFIPLSDGVGMWSKSGVPTATALRSVRHSPSKWAQIRFLMPFDQARIVSFAENWYRQRCGTEHEAQQKANDLLAALAQSEVTRQLARTPNLLSLMAIVHRERSHLPDGKALLYDDITNAYINTIDKQRKITQVDAALASYDWKERRAWLAYVGFQMQQLRGGEKKEGENTDDGVLANVEDVLAWLTYAMQLSKVEDPERAARTFLGWVARRSGLLLPRGEGRYAFVHLSFQEYFCACYLNARIVNPAFIRNKLKADDPVTRSRLTDWSKRTVWRETLVFLFELLSAERDADWVEDLVEILFGAKDDRAQLRGARAALAGRVLMDRHIRLGEEWKDRLADRCLNQAWEDWEFSEYGLDAVVLPALLATGYAAIVADSSSESNEIPELYRSLAKFISIEDIPAKQRLLICIVRNKNISDITSLSKFNNLRSLDLNNAQVVDITPLVGLNSLQSLSLNNTQVADITPLAGLNSLQNLDLNNTQVADITPLAGLNSLQSLSLSNTQVEDITPLAELNSLQRLSLNNTQVMDITPLAGLSNLHSLSLNSTQVANITPLAGLNSLQSLSLNSAQVADITPLAGLKSLRDLDLDSTQVSDIAPLAGLKNLDFLILRGRNISDLMPLGRLKNLSFLRLGGKNVSDITPLAGLKKLHHLDISGSKVTDVSPLAGLKRLHIEGLPSTDELKPRKKRKSTKQVLV